MKKITFRCVLIISFMLSGITGYGQNIKKQIHLIPEPRELTRAKGAFPLISGKQIYIVNPDDTLLLFPVNLFMREIKKDMNVEMSYGETAKKSAILIGYPGQDKKFDKITESYAARLKKCGKEGYVLHIDPKRIVLLANTDTGIFYGAQTLRQLVRGNQTGNTLPCLDITDWPALQYRGWQDDISRGPIPKMELLKKEIREMSFFKMNIFTLYTENVFKLKSYPYLAPPDGITARQVKELSAYARKYHVDLVGNFQAFGHFRKILEKPEFSSLAETPDVISPAFPETYELLRNILREIASAYESKFFMINCDEVFGLGSGPAKTMVDTMGLAGVYAYHINKLVNILKPFHKTILMWGDIARDYPEIISKLPKSIIVLPWAYNAASSFRDQIEPFKKAGMNFWVCPGVSCWGRIFPDLNTAKINISHFVRDGKAMGAQGMLNTTWDDDGENLFSFNWFPLSWGAGCAWNPVMRNDTLLNDRYRSFSKAFDPLFFGTEAGITNNMLRLSGLRKYASAGNLTDKAFWSPMIDEHFYNRQIVGPITNAMSLENEASSLIRAFQNSRGKALMNREDVDYLIFASQRVQYLARKNELKYRLNDPSEMEHVRPADLLRNLKGLENQLSVLKKDYARLWNMESRPWWLDHILARYDRMENELKAVPYHIFIEPDTSFFAPERTVVIRSLLPGKEIYYTLDGSLPDSSSMIYKGPFQIDTTTLIKATVLPGDTENIKNTVFVKLVRVYQGPVAGIRLAYPFSEKYSGHGVISLTDGIHGSKNYRDGNWLGFNGVDFVADIQLKKSIAIDTVTVTFLQNMRSWILFPEWVSCAVSEDGKHFLPEQKTENKINWQTTGTLIQPFSFAILKKNIRFIRIHAKNIGRLPAWHNSAGGKAWLFIDEIEIK